MESKKIKKSNGGVRVVAVEGLDGVGKSTLARAYCNRHPQVQYVECEPTVYSVDLYLMTDAEFRASPTGRMLMDIGDMAADYRKREDEALFGPILTDWSIWSAVAGFYAKDPGSLKSLLEAVEALRADHVVLPDRVVVLKGSYGTCQARLRSGVRNGEFNADLRSDFERRNELYDAMKDSGCDVRFISTDGKSPEDVLSEFEALSIWSPTAA